MFNVNQLKSEIIKPTLDLLNMHSENAVELLVFTCACESKGGTYLKQIKGPALGIYQMEPNTHQDIWVNYIYNNGALVQKMALNFNCVTVPTASRLIYDLMYSTAMARLHYRRFKEALPNYKDVEAMYAYYKKYYNTPAGKARKDYAIKDYEKFTGRKVDS